MNAKVEKLPKSQLKITVTVENKDVKEMYKQVLEQAVKDTEVDGFRKGHAPKEKVEQKLGVSKLYGNVINELLQKYYSQALKENHIQPISNPKVEIKEFDIEKDFQFEASVATKPEIKFKDYKKELEKYYKNKNEEVSKTNAEKLKKGEKIDHSHAHLHPNEIVKVLSDNAEVEIPDILVEEETNRLIARLVDQLLAAGMKTEDYLKSQGIDMDQLKKNYTQVAEENIKAELVLNELITQEKIEVKEEEIDQAIAAVEDEKAREELNNPVQKIYIKTVLEKNKLIENLIKEVEGENHHE
jgi:FKBP-type peptidyl-prolyl cis-trans isomerase (trigger factor)